MESQHPAEIGPHPTLPPEVMAALSRFGAIQLFPAGATIFERSAPGSAMYLIEEGTVELFFADVGRDVKRLVAGQFFGELALLAGDHLRTATAVTASDCRLRVIDQSTFEELLRWAPQLSVQLLRATCGYLLESERRLGADLRAEKEELERALDFLRRTRSDLDSAELLTLTDELTGLYNRRCLNRQSELLLRGADEGEHRLALLLADIDSFKPVNDSLGHAIGDLVLQRAAGALRESLRQTDLPCRLGGDEFAVLLGDVGEEEARATAQRLLQAVSTLVIAVPGRQLRFSWSVGGAFYRPGEGWESFFERADRSLYAAKESGRASVGWEGVVVGSER